MSEPTSESRDTGDGNQVVSSPLAGNRIIGGPVGLADDRSICHMGQLQDSNFRAPVSGQDGMGNGCHVHFVERRGICLPSVKTVFLLALASGARRREIHALDQSRIRWLSNGKDVFPR